MKVKLTQIADALAMLNRDNKEHNYPLLDSDIENMIHFVKPAGIATKTIMDIIFDKYIVTHRDASIYFKNLDLLAQHELTIVTGEFKLPEVVRAVMDVEEEPKPVINRIEVPITPVYDSSTATYAKITVYKDGSYTSEIYNTIAEARKVYAEKYKAYKTKVTYKKDYVHIFVDIPKHEDTKNNYMYPLDTDKTLTVFKIEPRKLSGGYIINLKDATKYNEMENSYYIDADTLTNLQENRKSDSPYSKIWVQLEVSENPLETTFIQAELLNELKFFYGIGTKIILGDKVFLNKKPVKLVKYTPEKMVGLTNHAKEYFKQKRNKKYPGFTYQELYDYNSYVNQLVRINNKTAWLPGRHFDHLVRTTFLNTNIIPMFNDKRICKEVYAQQEFIKDIPYYGQKLDPICKQELELYRHNYDIPSDTMEFRIRMVQTESGYTESPVIELAHKEYTINSSYAGTQFGQAKYIDKSEEKRIMTNPVEMSGKAVENYKLLEAYKNYGIPKMGYVICEKCGNMIKEDHAFCDCCDSMRSEVKVELDKAVNDMQSVLKVPERYLNFVIDLVIEDSQYIDVESCMGSYKQKEDVLEKIEYYSEVKSPDSGNRRKAKRIEKSKDDK